MPRIELEPLVSVVTPVFNTEQFLAECIESVLVQTYQNWEYVIVNNCSTDRSLEIAGKYAEQDTRIKILNNEEFLGLMPNWNYALRQISPESKYCKVIHADDWMFPECLTQMVGVAETYPAVSIVGAYRIDENHVNLDALPYPSNDLSGKEVCRKYFLENIFLFGSPSSILLRSDLIRQRPKFYNENNIHADLDVCIELLQDSDFGFVHQVLTFTRRHNEANTSFVRYYSTYGIGSFISLANYGLKYLSPEEYKRTYKKKQKNYYRSLGKVLLLKKSKKIYDYHKKALTKNGLELSPIKVVLGMFVVLYNFTLEKCKIA